MTFEEYVKEEREDAREEGRAEGRAEELLNLVKKKLERGDSVEKIADDLMETVEVIEEMVGQLNN